PHRVVQAQLAAHIDVFGGSNTQLRNVAAHVDDHGQDALNNKARAILNEGDTRAIVRKKVVSRFEEIPLDERGDHDSPPAIEWVQGIQRYGTPGIQPLLYSRGTGVLANRRDDA